MEREKRRKEAEEAELRRLAEERKLKTEMEARRKEEEAKRVRQEDLDRKQAEKLQADLDNANARIQQQVDRQFINPTDQHHIDFYFLSLFL